MIPATELFGSTRRSVLCSLFLSSGFVVARAWAFGASSVHFSLPRPLLSPERAREASGIVCRHADEGCPEEQLHRTRGCVTFCSRLRLVAFARRARASLFESKRAVLPALARVPHPNTSLVLGSLPDPAETSSSRLNHPRYAQRVINEQRQ